ncbi:MAG TPA: glycosyltransferase family 4 protein [Sedimentisphaerales bacterium]|nr:glycosyltransferase family 4 protein [Sedimentisphaerales bacterium]
MRIVQITPSAGDNFYCENCLRDTALARAILKLGHDVLMMPLYLPLQGQEADSAGVSPIFFGGINVFLQQKSALFRRTPRWLDRLFDSPKLLRWVARRAGMTSARDLGAMTVSMLRGEQGRQTKELDRLVEWLDAQDNKPDIVCLSNVLLIGLAKSIRQRLRVPVVCLLQDEDGFLDGLPPPYSRQAWQIVADRAVDVDRFVAVSKFYADVMRDRLGLQPEKVCVAHTGISLDGYEPSQAKPEVPTIGYLSRMCPDRGLDALVEAFVHLKSNPELKNARLRIAGGSTPDDREFLEKIRRRLNSCGLSDDVEFVEDFSLAARQAFLRTLCVLCVPEKQPVAYGLYVLEALAAGVPVVQPAHGVFPELLEMTGGGLLCEPNNAKAFAAALQSLLLDVDYARQLGTQGRNAVIEKFNISQTVWNLLRIYEEVVQHGI